MADNSWIKLHRSLLKDTLWTSECPASYKVLWINLLLMASYKDSSVYERQVKRGQVWTSQRKLAKMNHISNRDIKKILNMFIADGKLSVQYFSQGILITILNYSKFQASSVESTRESTNESTNESSECITRESTNERHSINNKEVNKNFLRNEEEKGRRPRFRDPNSFED